MRKATGLRIVSPGGIESESLHLASGRADPCPMSPESRRRQSRRDSNTARRWGSRGRVNTLGTSVTLCARIDRDIPEGCLDGFVGDPWVLGPELGPTQHISGFVKDLIADKHGERPVFQAPEKPRRPVQSSGQSPGRGSSCRRQPSEVPFGSRSLLPRPPFPADLGPSVLEEGHDLVFGHTALLPSFTDGGKDIIKGFCP